MVKFQIDPYTFYVHLGGRPDNFNRWVERSNFSDLDGLTEVGTPVYIGIEKSGQWDMMIVAFNADPINDTFFQPELLFTPETNTFFIGGGRRAMTYSLKDKVKLSNRGLAMGFWYWAKHDDFIILVAELEIAVYDYNGNFLWETRTEPPWSYGVQNSILTLDIMNTIIKYELNTGNLIR